MSVHSIKRCVVSNCLIFSYWLWRHTWLPCNCCAFTFQNCKLYMFNGKLLRSMENINVKRKINVQSKFGIQPKSCMVSDGKKTIGEMVGEISQSFGRSFKSSFLAKNVNFKGIWNIVEFISAIRKVSTFVDSLNNSFNSW